MAKTLLLEELTSTEFSGLNLKKCLLVWPIASIEQHGPYLPLGTDLIILTYIAGEVRKKLDNKIPVIFGPPLPIGKSPEHLDFPGTISLTTKTILNVIEDIVTSLAAHNFKRLVFLNGHGGNINVLQALGPDLRYKHDIELYYIDLWGGTFFNDAIHSCFPNLPIPDIHAASAETSMLLYIRPDLVKPTFSSATSTLSTISTSYGIKVNNEVSFGWVARDFGESGIIGDPSQASVEAGKYLVDYAVNKVCRLLERIYASNSPNANR